jgi:hypothetical protein
VGLEILADQIEPPATFRLGSGERQKTILQSAASFPASSLRRRAARDAARMSFGFFVLLANCSSLAGSS